MTVDFSRTPTDEYDLSPELIEEAWTKISRSLEKKDVEEFSHEQKDIIDRINHNATGVILTSHGKEVAMILPFEYSKSVLTLMHFVKTEHMRATMDEAD